MKLTTTLAILRAHEPCTQGWSKLRRTLGSGFPDDKPIDFGVILESNGIDDALWALRGVVPEQEAARDRLARLFACDCAESVLHLYEKDYPEDKRPREAIRVARAFAEGKATREELAAARAAARDAARAAARAAAWDAAWDAARAAAEKKYRHYFVTPESEGGAA
ncbi:MAG TPA: Imm5 family immunity protein [Chthoniobacterales bacterium]|nr:Imm5 family immunity protein [Chthoniobacterales bacterium]